MYKLPELEFSYNALEPYIDTQTMEIHHSKHHQTYVNNLNKALENYPEYIDTSVEQLIANLHQVPESIRMAVRNNGGGHFNHTFFWSILGVGNTFDNSKMLGGTLIEEFGSFERFQKDFTNTALTRFGSGWAWLVIDTDKSLKITSTPNQDCPLSEGQKPLLTIDLWEHAYYLKYQNKRADYIESWWNVIDWKKVEEIYKHSL